MLRFLPLPIIGILIIVAVYLRFYRKNKPVIINNVLSLIILILIYNLLIIYGFSTSWLRTLAFHLTYTDALFFYLISPLFYIMLLYIIENKSFSSISNAIHFWPSVIGITYTVYFQSQPTDIQWKIAIGDKCGVLHDSYLFGLGVLSIVIYVFKSIKLIHRKIKNDSSILNIKSVNQLQLYIWFLTFCLFFTIGLVALLLLGPITSEVHNVIVPFLILLSLLYIWLIFYIKPDKLYYKHIDDNKDINGENGLHLLQSNQNLKDLLTNIDNKMLSEKYFLKQDLSLIELSKLVDVPPYRISMAINKIKNSNFSNYVNEFRVNYAIEILKSNNVPKLDVLAYDCGFANRSNFYKVFKKTTGYTPVQYKSVVLNANNKL